MISGSFLNLHDYVFLILMHDFAFDSWILDSEICMILHRYFLLFFANYSQMMHAWIILFKHFLLRLADSGWF